jgi:tetratricopeptide (TPR) repeat protein
MFEEEDEFYDGNFNEDLERFERSLKGEQMGFLDSDQLDAILDHYLIHGHYSKAILCADRGTELFPFNLVFTLRKAQAMSAMGQLKEALTLLSQIEKRDNPTCEFMLTKASIFSQLRDSKNAIKHFKEALLLSEPEDKDEIYLDLAMEYENINDYSAAILILEEAIQYNVSNEVAIYEIAFCYDQIGDYPRAIKCYSDFIDENPYSFTAWYNLGNAYSKTENWEKAVWAYDYCMLINDEFSPAYFNLGNAYLSMDKYELSIECFEKCMELDGEDGLALCYIGECHEQLANYDLSKHYYHRSIEFVPELAEAWLGLGIVADLEGKTKEGIVLIQKAIEIDPLNASFHHVLAGAYEKLEEWDDANTAYELALELDPTNDEIISDYAQFLIELDELIEAKDWLDELPENADLSVLVDTLKAVVAWKLGNKETALFLLNHHIANDPESVKETLSLFPDLLDQSEIIHLF